MYYSWISNKLIIFLHTIDAPKGVVSKDEADVFLCKLSNIPPCLAHTLAWTEATENVPNLTRADFVDFKTFASND